MDTYPHGPMDAAKNLKLRSRVGDLDLPGRRTRCTNRRVEEEVDARNCPRGKAVETRTHTVAGYERYKEEREVPEREMRNVNEGDMRR